VLSHQNLRGSELCVLVCDLGCWGLAGFEKNSQHEGDRAADEDIVGPGDGWPPGWHEERPSLSQEICPFDFSNRGAYRGCMSFAQITQEALSLPSPERRQLIARLVAAGTDEDLALKTTLAEKIDDRRAENWVALDDLKKQFKDL
jgi:hypothetical protein